MRLVLERLETSDEGTFGRVVLPSGRILFTGELPDRDNASNISCIPKGKYYCKRTYSNRFRRPMYWVFPVQGREGIRIHSANFMGDKSKGLRCHLNGCIAFGGKLGMMDGQKAILVSAPAISAFEAEMNYDPFDLVIV